MKWIARAFDTLRGPRILETIWRLITCDRALSKSEFRAASSVLGPSAIRYDEVRVADGGLLWLIFKFNKKRAFATFHTINIPDSGGDSSPDLDVVVHELVHVYQFEIIGSIYIWQALRAQCSNGYKYGGWRQLKRDWKKGVNFSDYNREQQGQIAQDYYRKVVVKGLSAENPVTQAYEPFINELRNGKL